MMRDASRECLGEEVATRLSLKRRTMLATLCVGVVGCTVEWAQPQAAISRFESDLGFLRQHTSVVLLHDSSGEAQVVVAPEYQGRVMTSTAGGGDSFGWMGRAAISSRARQAHINVFGGEDRFWLGPE